MTRLQILQKSNRGEEIADADFLLRGPGELVIQHRGHATNLANPFLFFDFNTGDVLGIVQSGMKFGSTVDRESHWDLLNAATHFGTGFMQQPTSYDKDVPILETGRETPADVLLSHLLEGKMKSFYNQTSASSKRGFALRMMMAFFGQRSIPESNTLQAINTLHRLDESRGAVSQDDESTQKRIVTLFGDYSHSQPSKNVDVSERKAKSEDASPVTLTPKVCLITDEC